MVYKLKRKLFFLICIAVFSVSWVSADEYNGTMDLFESSPVLKPYFDNSFGYAVFPRVGKGGVFFGASHGKGKVYKLGQVVGAVELNEFTIGLQFGGQSFSEIIFFQDERAFDEFTTGAFEIDASISAAAVVASSTAEMSAAVEAAFHSARA